MPRSWTRSPPIPARSAPADLSSVREIDAATEPVGFVVVPRGRVIVFRDTAKSGSIRAIASTREPAPRALKVRGRVPLPNVAGHIVRAVLADASLRLKRSIGLHDGDDHRARLDGLTTHRLITVAGRRLVGVAVRIGRVVVASARSRPL